MCSRPPSRAGESSDLAEHANGWQPIGPDIRRRVIDRAQAIDGEGADNAGQQEHKPERDDDLRTDRQILK